jgi:hypothetical protein
MGIWQKFLGAVFEDRIQNAVDTQVVRQIEEIQKSMGDNVSKEQRSWLLDMLNAQTAMGFKETPASITYNTLRRISRRNPVIAAIINTRVNQVASFSKQSDILEKSQNKPIGFKVVHKRKDAKEMSTADTKRCQEMEEFISGCGYTDRFRTGRKRDGFTDFAKKVTRDRLTFDQMCFEKVLNRKGEPAEIFAVDAATIRLASEDSMDEGIGYVQVVNGQVRTEYAWAEMGFCIANPTTDINQYGYGFSEIEQLITIITALINSDTYNNKFFSQGLGTQGILNLVTKDGAIPPDVLNAFKVQLQTQASGVQNAWKTPVLNADKAEWINLKPNNRDMEFANWVEYLIKLACAVYQIAPEEINFESKNQGSSRLFEAGPESKLKYSKDKGLRPLLNFVADSVTEHFVEPYYNDLMCIFTGMDEKSEVETVDIRTKEGQAYRTIDELREEAGYGAIGTEKGGDLILSPQYVQWVNTKAMTESMSQETDGEPGGLIPHDQGLNQADKGE